MRRKNQTIILVAFLLAVGAYFYFVPNGRKAVIAQQQNPPSSNTAPSPSPTAPKNPCSPTKNACSPTVKKPRNPCSPTGVIVENEVYEPANNFSGWKKLNETPILSEAHEGMWVVTYANPVAQEAIKAGQTTFPVGSMLIKDSFIDDNGAPGGRVAVFAMEKRKDGWLWVKTNIQGEIMRGGTSATMKSCAQCHTAAKTDFAFLKKS
jgi:hypothetical protein